jgi:predicted Co/Zn/Cd cation transporter (cation efflux family)
MKTFFNKLLSDKHEINEKNFIGVSAFGVMVTFAFADIGTGIAGQHLVISDTIYNSFLIIVLGAFSISGAEKIMKKGDSSKPTENEPQ